MTYAASIIEKFGGTRPMAAALNIPPSTVQSWKKRGLIPAQHQPMVLREARKKGVPLEPADFFALPHPDQGAAA